MGKKSKYYTRYKFNDNSSYKAVADKDGVTDEDMRNIKRVRKSQDKVKAKVEKLDTTSLDAILSGEDKHSVLIDETVDTELIIETADEYESLHKAVEKLLPEQKKAIEQIYFNGKQATDFADELGISKQALNRRLNKIYTRLEKYLKNF